jgi:hypothetical protein
MAKLNKVDQSMNATNKHSPQKQHMQQAESNVINSQASLAFIIQNEKEVSPWKSTPPMSTTDLNNYVAVKFTSVISGTMGGINPGEMRVSMIKPNYQVQSFISVWVSKETNMGKIKDIVEGSNIQ